MAYPSVDGSNNSQSSGNETSHTISLPASITENNLVVIFFATDGDVTITWPAGWSEIFQTTHTGAAETSLGACYKVAGASEPGSVEGTTSASETSVHLTYEISGYTGTPEAGSPVFHSDDTSHPDPPSLTPTWGSDDTLWFAVFGNDGQSGVSAYPSDYTDGAYELYNHSAGCGVGVARRERAVAAEDPGTFTISPGIAWIAQTVAIQPSVSGGNGGAEVDLQYGAVV